MNKLTLLLALILTCKLNAQNFTPSTYSPALWLDASDTTSVIHSSGTVSAWNDLSGNGNNVTQTTAFNRPKYLNTTQGIAFDEIELKFPATLGIENFASINNNLKLYPNPAKNEIFLKSDKKELSQIKIFDLLGKDLTQKALISVLGTDKVNIDLSNFKQGIYIIKTKTIANKVYKK
ncbi:T9SS type A sorting domain-containing protein [Vicingaceae bacterium]|nr:T9SS type A sorting domain-containing protein [Vicingaceae bacterium]MDC1452385.1 T9SS type A sorting domain-containing protein [Vicingaceae bacterium]